MNETNEMNETLQTGKSLCSANATVVNIFVNETELGRD